MPSPCAVARSFAQAPGAKMPTRSLTSWAAIRKPHATPSTPSTTKGCRRPSSRDRSIRTPFIGPSIPNRLRPCGRCSTALRGSLAVRVASGVWRWRQRLPLRRDSSKGRSRGRPSGLLLCAFSESGGRERNAGSPLPTPSMKEKKTSRSTDGSGRGQPRHLGGGFLGRVLVESAGIAHFEQLERAGKASSSPPEVGRQRRPRAEGHLLLRALCAPTRPDVDQVRGWEAHQFHNNAIPFVEPAKAPSGGKESYGPHLGQRFLAHLQRGQALARKTQPPGQREWRRSEDRKLLVAQTQPVAERHRTQVDTRQAKSG